MMRQLWCLTALLMLSFGALAQTPKQITFQGVIKNPNGSLPTESGLTATIRILAPNGCVLWQEQHTSVSITDGYINLVVGSGTPGGYQPAGQTFDKVFDNTTPQVGLTCLNADSSVNGSLTSYVPSAQDARKVRLETTLAQGAVLADFNLRSMPFAVAAQSANKIGSKSEADLLAVNSSAGLTQASLEAFIQSLTSVPGGSAKWDGSNFVSYDPTNGANLSSGSVPASAVASLPWSKLTSIPSPLSQIGGLSCVNGKILKMVSGSWACADDDTLSPNTNKGDIAVHNGTNNVRFPAGTDGYVLTADSSQTAGVKWAAAAAAGGGLTYQSVSTGTYSVTGTDDKKLLGVSVGSAISLPDTTGLSDGFMVVIGRLGTSPVSITPYGSQKISGLSSRTLVAQYDLINLIKIGTDWIVQAQVANDPCGVNPTPGVTCSGGVKYAGAYYSPATGFAKLMTTPGNCTDSATPTCNNAADALTKQFATANSTTGGVSADDGWANSVTQAAVGIDVAAKWCRNLNYGGYTDWYLPSQNELTVLYVNSAAITGFESGGSYWSSTETTSTDAFYVSFSDGSFYYGTKTTSYYVRCVRRY